MAEGRKLHRATENKETRKHTFASRYAAIPNSTVQALSLGWSIEFVAIVALVFCFAINVLANDFHRSIL